MSRSVKRITGKFETASRRMPHEVVPFPRPFKTSVARAVMGSEQYLRQKEMLDRNLAELAAQGILPQGKKNQIAGRASGPVFEQATKGTTEHIDNIFSSAFAHIAPGGKLTY